MRVCMCRYVCMCVSVCVHACFCACICVLVYLCVCMCASIGKVVFLINNRILSHIPFMF